MTEDVEKAYVSQEFILEIILVFHTRTELEEAEDDTSQLDKLPRWTVLEGKKGFYVEEEGIALVKRLLAKRFSDPLRAYIKDEVVVELHIKPENDPESSFEC
jgi:hypothetical protein